MIPFGFLFETDHNNAVVTLLVMREKSVKSTSPKSAAHFGILLTTGTMVLWSVVLRLQSNLASD